MCLCSCCLQKQVAAPQTAEADAGDADEDSDEFADVTGQRYAVS